MYHSACCIWCMSKLVTLHEATRRFARFIREVAAGEEFVITLNGTPVARLVPAGQRRELTGRQLAALERFRAIAKEGWPIGAGPLDRDVLHER
jgi:prevent-host-death family protein